MKIIEIDKRKVVELWNDLGKTLSKKDTNYAVLFTLGEHLIRFAMQSVREADPDFSEAKSIIIVNELRENLIAFSKSI